MNVKPGLSPALARIVLTIVALAVLAMIVGLVVLGFRLRAERRALEAVSLRADSLVAASDSTRRTALSERAARAILGDSLQALERRVVQLAAGPRRDALDEATGRSSVFRGSIVLTPSRIATEASGASSVVAGTDVRLATFHVDSSAAVATPRFVADAAVRIPPPPTAASLQLGVTLSPIVLQPRIQCGDPDAGGVRPASLAVVGPVGVPLEVGPLEADVHACNPEFGRPTGIRVGLTTLTLVALLSALLGAFGASH